MKHQKFIIEKSQKLRGLGKTYSEIQRYLKTKIPKSTLSYWCKKIPLPQWYEKKIQHLNEKNLSKAQKMAWISNKRKQDKLIHEIWEKNKNLLIKIKDKDTLKMLLSMLYLGEGAKWKSHRGLYLGSSNPEIIKLYMHLLKLCYGIEAKIFKASICYRADQNIKSLQKYWSRVTSVPLKNFYPSKPDRRTIGKLTRQKKYKGVCSLTCKGTHIQLELETIPKLLLTGL